MSQSKKNKKITLNLYEWKNKVEPCNICEKVTDHKTEGHPCEFPECQTLKHSKLNHRCTKCGHSDHGHATPHCKICNSIDHVEEDHFCDYCNGAHDTDNHDFENDRMYIFDGPQIKNGDDITFVSCYGERYLITYCHELHFDYVQRAMRLYKRIDNPRSKFLPSYYAVGKHRFGKYYQIMKSYGVDAQPSKLHSTVKNLLIEKNSAFHVLTQLIIEYIAIDIYRRCPNCGKRGIELNYEKHNRCTKVLL